MCQSNVTITGIAIFLAMTGIILSVVSLNSHVWIEGCQSIAALERTKVVYNISNAVSVNPLLEKFHFCITLGLFHLEISIPVLQTATKYAVPVESIRHEIRGTAAFLIIGILFLACSVASSGILAYYAIRVANASKNLNEKFIKVALTSGICGAICIAGALLLFTISLHELAQDSEQFLQEIGSVSSFLLPGISTPTNVTNINQHPHVRAFRRGFKTSFGYGFFLGWAVIPTVVISNVFFAYVYRASLNAGFGKRDIQMNKITFNKI